MIFSVRMLTRSTEGMNVDEAVVICAQTPHTGGGESRADCSTGDLVLQPFFHPKIPGLGSASVDAINPGGVLLLAKHTKQSCSPGPCTDFPGEAMGVFQRREKSWPHSRHHHLEKRAAAAAANLFSAWVETSGRPC